MTAMVSTTNAEAARLTGMAGARARAADMVTRATAYAAAAVLAGAARAALLQLVAQILSFPAPIAAAAMTLMATALLHSLRRHLRTPARRRSGPGKPAQPAG